MAAIDSIQPLMFSLLALTIALSTTSLTCTALADSTSHSSGEIIVHELPREWHMWKAEHGKLYQSLGEELQRHMVWHNNMKMIERHNAESATHGYTLKMNHLGDLTDEEYRAQYSCVKNPLGSTRGHDKYSLRKRRNSRSPMRIYRPPINASLHLPDIVDWHTKGAVTDIKTQGECCSSYAFSIVAALEGSHALATGELVSLSEQNVVDCSGVYGNHGCQSGQMDTALEYIIDSGGLNTESSYPYEGISKRCRFNKNKIGASIRSYQLVRKGEEADLQVAVAMQGPVAAAVDATHNTFRFYEGGVFDTPNCSSVNVTHAMTIIGYGTHSGKPYWLLKNSWGTSWGDKGYIMMARNRSNQCGIASNAIFPTL